MANVKEKNVETLNNKEAFFMKYKKAIIIAVVALFVIVIGAILYNNYVKQPREAEASTALAKGQEYFAAQQFDKALNGDGAGAAGFVKIAADYSGTAAGNLANLYAGLCYANLEKWNEAVKYLEEYNASDDQMVSPAAVGALADAYANTKQLDKAVETFKKAANMADKEGVDGKNNSLSPAMLIKAAEILESQNKKADALEIYKDIKKNYVNSPVSQEIDKYIERVSE